MDYVLYKGLTPSSGMRERWANVGGESAIQRFDGLEELLTHAGSDHVPLSGAFSFGGVAAPREGMAAAGSKRQREVDR